jgi:hypothetical protein
MTVTGFGWGIRVDTFTALQVSIDDRWSTFEGPPLALVNSADWVMSIIGALHLSDVVTADEAALMILRGRDFYEREGWSWPKAN